MIRRDHISLTYRLTFESAFHCGTGLASGLIHRSVQKDKENYLYVPGSTVKGVLRETCEYLARILVPDETVRDPHDEKDAVKSFFEQDIVESIFGSRFQESGIFFDNAYMPSDIQKDYRFMQIESRTQTRLSRLTRTVIREALYSSEFGISELQFEGKIHGWLEGIANPFSDELPGSYPLYLLIAGMCMTNRIGANRSTGMGCCCFNIRELQVKNTPMNPKSYLEKIDEFCSYTDAKMEVQ